MFERFTDRARRVVVLAQEEARTLNHDYIGTEHILLGLIHEGNGVAARALDSMGIRQEVVRQRIEEIIGRGKSAPPGHIPFTPRAKKVLQLALRESLQLGHDYIGTEHILLGLIREGDGVAAQVLVSLGADLNAVRQQVIEILHGHQAELKPAPARGGLRSGTGGRGTRKLLAEVLDRLDSMESRLSALERRVGAGPDIRELNQQIARVRGDKEAAIDTENFEAAAELRDRERELLSEKESRQLQWAAAQQDLPSLSDELERLHALLREHGIEPQDGAA